MSTGGDPSSSCEGPSAAHRLVFHIKKKKEKCMLHSSNQS